MLPEVGDYVRVSCEGTVTRTSTFNGGRIWVSGDSGLTVLAPVPMCEFEKTEPEYADGNVYEDADGIVYMYDARTNTWSEFGTAVTYSSETPKRPLERMMTGSEFRSERDKP